MFTLKFRVCLRAKRDLGASFRGLLGTIISLHSTSLRKDLAESPPHFSTAQKDLVGPPNKVCTRAAQGLHKGTKA